MLMKTISHVKLPAKIDSLSSFIRLVAGIAEKHVMSREQINLIELSTEEILVNIINYAYPEKIGDVEVICGESQDGEFILKFIDSGIPFNLLSVKEPNTKASIEDRPIGGLGIYLVKKLMKDIKYTRDANRNILTIWTGLRASDSH